MDKSGTMVLGDPNVIAAKAKKDEEKKKQATKGSGGKGKPKKKGQQEITGFADLLKKLPMKVKVGFGVLVLVGILFGAGFRLPKLFKSTPKTVEDISAAIVDAWVDNKLPAIQKFAMPGSDDAVKKWYDELRPKFEFQGPQNPQVGDTVDPILNGVLDQDGGRIAMVNLYYLSATTPAGVKEEKALIKDGKRSQLKGENEAGYKWNGGFTLPLYFVPEGETYKLDAAKSLEVGLPKPKEEPKKKKR